MATEKRAERKLELSVIVSRKIIFLYLSSMLSMLSVIFVGLI